MNKLDAYILLVEDEPNLQYLFERQLKVLGYAVPDMADNGLLAVEKTLKNRYDLVFMDVRLPELDGLLATGRIRQSENEAGIHTPIVGMTAFANRQSCLNAGMDDFLQKPVMLQQLDDALNNWLAAAAKQPVSVQATNPIEETKFQRTDQRLKVIKARIDDLRKRVGLE